MAIGSWGLAKDMAHLTTNKINSRIELKQGYTDSTVGYNYNPVAWLMEINGLERGLIIWLQRKGGGLERHAHRYT